MYLANLQTLNYVKIIFCSFFFHSMNQIRNHSNMESNEFFFLGCGNFGANSDGIACKLKRNSTISCCPGERLREEVFA